MTGDGSFFPDPPASQYHSSKSVLSHHPVLEFNGNKNDFWLLFDDSDMLEKHQSRPLKKPQKPSEPQASSSKSVVAVSKPGFTNTFSEATSTSGFLRPKDEPEDKLLVASDRITSKERLDLDSKQARLERLIRTTADPVPRKKEVAKERRRSRSRERRQSPSRERRRSRSLERRRSRSLERRRSRSPGRRRSPVRDRRGLYGDKRRSRSREGRGRDRSRSRDRFRRSKDPERRKKSPSSSRKDSRSRRSSSTSSSSPDVGSKGKVDKADKVELLKKFAEKLQEQANKSSITKKSLSSVRLNSRLEDTKHRRAEPVTPIVFSMKKAPTKAFPSTAMPEKKENVAEPMELSEPYEQVSSTIHIPLPTDIQYSVPPPLISVPPPVSLIPPPLIPGNLPVSQHLQPLRVTDGVTVACAPTLYKDGKKAPVSSAVIALPQSSQPPPAIARVPLPAVSQHLAISQPTLSTSQPPPLMSLPPPKVSQPMEAPAITEMHQDLAAQALHYAAMTQGQDSMFQMGQQNMGVPPPGFGPMMRVPPGPPPGRPRPGHGIRPGMMGPGHGPMMMGHRQFGAPRQFMGPPPHGPEGHFMGPLPHGPDGQFMGRPPHGPERQFMGPPPHGPEGQFMGPHPLGPDGQFMGPPPRGLDGQFTVGRPEPGIRPPFLRPQGGPISNNIAVTITSTQSIHSASSQQPNKITAAAKIDLKTTYSSLKTTPSAVGKGETSSAEAAKPSSSPVKTTTTSAEKGRTTSSIPDKKKSLPKPVLSSLSIPNFEKVKFMVDLIKFLQDRSSLNIQIATLKTSPSEEYCMKNGLLCKLEKGPDNDFLIIVVPEDGNARKTIVTAFVLKYPDLDVDALIELFEQTFHNMPMEDIEDVFEDESTRKSTLLKSTEADFSKIKSISSSGTVVLRVESSKNTKVEIFPTALKIAQVEKTKTAENSNKNVEIEKPTQKIETVEKVESAESSEKNVEKVTPTQKIEMVEKVKSAESSKNVEKVTPTQKIETVEKVKPAESSDKNIEKVTSLRKIETVEKVKSAESSYKNVEKVTPTQKIETVEKVKSAESSDKNVEAEKSNIVGSSEDDVKKEKTEAHSSEKSGKIATDSSKDIGQTSVTMQSEMKTSEVQSKGSAVSVTAKNTEAIKDKKVEPINVDKGPSSAAVVFAEQTKPQTQLESSKAKDVPADSTSEEKSELEASVSKEAKAITPCLAEKPVLIVQNPPTDQPPDREMTKVILASSKVEHPATVEKSAFESEAVSKASDSTDSDTKTKSLDTARETTVVADTCSTKVLPTHSPEICKDVTENMTETQTQSEPMETSEILAPTEEEKIPTVSRGEATNQLKPPTQHEPPRGNGVAADPASEKKSELNAITSEQAESIAPVEKFIPTQENSPKDQPSDSVLSETPTVTEKSTSQGDAVFKAYDSIDSDTKNKSPEAVKEPTENISNEPAPKDGTKTQKDVNNQMAEVQTQSESKDTSDILVVNPPEAEEVPTVFSGEATNQLKPPTQHEFPKGNGVAADPTSEKKSELNAITSEQAESIAPVEKFILTQENSPKDQPSDSVLSETHTVTEKSTSQGDAVSKASDSIDSDTKYKSPEAVKEPTENISKEPAPKDGTKTQKDVNNQMAEVQTQSESKDTSDILVVNPPEEEKVPTVFSGEATNQLKPPTQHESPRGNGVAADPTSEKKSEPNAITSEQAESIAPVEKVVLAEEIPPKDQPSDHVLSETPKVMDKSGSQVDAVFKASDSIGSDNTNQSPEAVKERNENINNEPAPSGRTKTQKDETIQVAGIQTQSEPMETSEVLVVEPPEDEEIPSVLSDGASTTDGDGATTQKTEASAGSNEATRSEVPSTLIVNDLKTTSESVASKDIEPTKSELDAIMSETVESIAPSPAEKPVLTVKNSPNIQPLDPDLSETITVIEKSTSEVDTVCKASDSINSDTKNKSLDAVKEPTESISNEPAASVATETDRGVTEKAVDIQTQSGPIEMSKILVVNPPVDEKTPTVSSGEASKSDHVGLTVGSEEAAGSGVPSILIVNEPKVPADAEDIEIEDKNVDLIELGDQAPSTAIFPDPKEAPTQPEFPEPKAEAADSTYEKKFELNVIASEKAEAITPSPVKNPVLTEGNPPNYQPLDSTLSETPKVIENPASEVDAVSTASYSTDSDTKNKSLEAVKEVTVDTETISTQVLPTEAAESLKMIDGNDGKDAADPIKGETTITSNFTEGTSDVSVDKIPKMPIKSDPLQELPTVAFKSENISNEPASKEGTATHEDVAGKLAEIQTQPEPMETSDVPVVKEEIKMEGDIPKESLGITEDGSKQPTAAKSTEGMDSDEATDQAEIQPPPTPDTNETTAPEKSADLIQATSSTKQIAAVIKSEKISEIKEDPESKPESIDIEEEPTTTEIDVVKSEIIPTKTDLSQKPKFSKFKSTYELMKSMDSGEPKETYKEPDALAIVNYDQLSFFTSRLKEIQRSSDVASIITKMLLVPYNPADEFVLKSGLLCKRKDQQKNDVFIVLLKSTAVYREIVSALTEQYPDLEFNEFMSLIDSSFTYITLDVIKSLTDTIDLQAVNIKYQNFIERCNIVNYDIIQTMLEQLRNYQKADNAILHRYTRLKANGGLDDSYILKYDIVCQFVGSIDFKVWLPKSKPDQIAVMYIVHETNHNQDLVQFLELLRATFEGVNASLIDKPIALCSVCHPPATATATSIVKVCEQRCAALKSLPPEVIFKIRQIQMASSVFKAQIDLLTKGQSRQGSRYILDTSLLCKAMTKGDEQVFRVVVSPSGLKEVISLLHTTYHRKPLDEFVSFVNEFLAVTIEVCKAAFQECYICLKSKTPKTFVDAPKPQTPKINDAAKPLEKIKTEPPQVEIENSSTGSSNIPPQEDVKPKEREHTRKESPKSTKDAPSEPSSQQQSVVASTSKVTEPEPTKSTWAREKSALPPKTARGERIRRDIMRDLRRYYSIWNKELSERIKYILRIVPDRILSETVTNQRSCPEILRTINNLEDTTPIKDAKEVLCGGVLFVLKGKAKPKIAVKNIKNVNFWLITKIHSEVHDWSINKVHGTIGIAFDISPSKEEVEATIDWFCHRCMKPETKKKKKIYSSLDEQLKDFYSTLQPTSKQAKPPKEKEDKTKKTVEDETNKDLKPLDGIWGKELGEKIKAALQPIPATVLKAIIAAQQECSTLMEIIEPLEAGPPVKDARYVLCGGILFVVKSKKKQMLVKIHVKPIANINYILITNLHAECHDWTVNRLQTTIGISFDVSPTREEVAVTIEWFCLQCQKPDTKSKKKKATASLEEQLKDLYDTIDPSKLLSKDDDCDQEGTIDLTQEVPVTDIRAALVELPNPVVSKIQQAQVQSNVLNTQIKLLENTDGPAKGKGYCLVMSLLCKLVEVNGKVAWRVMIPSDMLEELVIELHTVHYHIMIQEDFSEYLNRFMTVPEDMINKLFASCALCLTTVRRVPTLCERGINEDHLRKTMASIAEMIEYIVKWQTECPQISKIRDGVKRCRQEIIEQYILYKDVLFKLCSKGKGGKGPKGKIAVSLLPNALKEVIKGVHAFYHSSNPNQLMNLINTCFDVTARRDAMLETIPEVCMICRKKSEAAQQADANTAGVASAADLVKGEPENPDDGSSSRREKSGGIIIKEEVDLPIEIKDEKEEEVDLPDKIKAEDGEPTPLGVLLLGRLCDQVIEESSNSSRALDSPVSDFTETKPSLVVLPPYEILIKRCTYDPEIVQVSEGAFKKRKDQKKPPAKRGRPPKSAKIVKVSESSEYESDSGSSLPKRKFVVYSSESETDDSTSKKRKATAGSSQRAKKQKK